MDGWININIKMIFLVSLVSFQQVSAGVAGVSRSIKGHIHGIRVINRSLHNVTLMQVMEDKVLDVSLSRLCHGSTCPLEKFHQSVRQQTHFFYC